MNQNINFHNSNDLNISNSSEKELNDILTEDLLTYSEDKSQSIINMQQMINNNNRIIDNHNQSLKNLIPKNGVNQSNNNDSSFLKKNNYKNEYKYKNYDLKEKDNNKRNSDINNGNNKDLSSLQISLSNLLSDIDSKDNINQNNKAKDSFNNNTNQIGKNNDNNYEKHNFLIDISNENGSSISNNNTNNNNNNNNITLKNKNEEQSSAYSVCNYSQSLHISNNNTNINNNTNKNKYEIENNFINTNNYIKNKPKSNSLKFNKEQNINIFINPKEKHNKKIRKKIMNNNILNECKKNNNDKKNINSSFKHKYQIEKGENIQLSIISNLNSINKDSILDNYGNNLSINKGQYFTINNTTINSNYNLIENSDLTKKNYTTSLEIIKEQIKFNKKNGKMKLISNKNIDIQKDESKNFFYNPKINNITNQLNYNKDNIILKNKKTDFNLNFNNNKTESSDLRFDTYPNNNKDKKLIITNFNRSDKKNNNCYKNINKNANISNNAYTHNNSKKCKSLNKKNNKKEDIKQYIKKLYYINKKRKTISTYNSHNNSCSKKNNQIMKISNTRNLELNDMNTKHNFSVTFNNKKNNDIKSLSKSKHKNKIKNNECIAEPSKNTNKSKYFNDSHKKTNLITNDFMNQIKSAQKETTNKLINKLNFINNMNINTINKKSLFPLFSKVFEKKFDNSSDKKKIKNQKESYTKKTSNSKSKKACSKNNKPEQKINKINCFTDDINNTKQKCSKKKNDKVHKKINTQINLVSLLNNFNKKEKNRKNNKSLFNFGNIFFINQSQMVKKDSDIISNNIHEKNEINKEKIIIINDNYDNSKLNTLNYSNIKQRPQIINDFSNYKKKNNNKGKNIDNEINIIKNNDEIIKPKRFNTDILLNKNHFNIKNKIKDSFKIKKVEGDNGNGIIREIF